MARQVDRWLAAASALMGLWVALSGASAASDLRSEYLAWNCPGAPQNNAIVAPQPGQRTMKKLGMSQNKFSSCKLPTSMLGKFKKKGSKYKSCAFVGNAGWLVFGRDAGHGLGKAIDSHDHVIRFNYGQPYSQIAAYTGARETIRFINGAGTVKLEKGNYGGEGCGPPVRKGLALMFMKGSSKAKSKSGKLAAALKKAGTANTKFWETKDIDGCSRFLGKAASAANKKCGTSMPTGSSVRCSQGLLGIYLLAKDCARVTFYGYADFEAGEQTYSYAKVQKSALSGTHGFQAEALVVKSLADVYPVTFTRCLASSPDDCGMHSARTPSKRSGKGEGPSRNEGTLVRGREEDIGKPLEEVPLAEEGGSGRGGRGKSKSSKRKGGKGMVSASELLSTGSRASLEGWASKVKYDPAQSKAGTWDDITSGKTSLAPQGDDEPTEEELEAEAEASEPVPRRGGGGGRGEGRKGASGRSKGSRLSKDRWAGKAPPGSGLGTLGGAAFIKDKSGNPPSKPTAGGISKQGGGGAGNAANNALIKRLTAPKSKPPGSKSTASSNSQTSGKALEKDLKNTLKAAATPASKTEPKTATKGGVGKFQGLNPGKKSISSVMEPRMRARAGARAGAGAREGRPRVSMRSYGNGGGATRV